MGRPDTENLVNRAVQTTSHRYTSQRLEVDSDILRPRRVQQATTRDPNQEE